MDYQTLNFDVDSGVATITLNRPEKLNALSNNLRGELMEAMREAEADAEIGVIVLKFHA